MRNPGDQINLFLSFGNFIFKYRNAMFPAVFAVLFLISRPQVLMNNPRLDWFVVTVGAALAAGGTLFRLMVIGFAYIKRGGKEGRVYADHLVVRGFYAHSRNPMYVGNLMITTGVCLMYGSLPAFFLVIPFFWLAYLSIVVAEETYLRKKFGTEYDEYARRVNRFIPDFRGLKKSLGEFRYDWKKAIRKDYGTTFGVTCMILFLIAWKLHDTSDLGTKLRAFFLNPFFWIAFGFYGWARIWKKTGRLASPNPD